MEGRNVEKLTISLKVNVCFIFLRDKALNFCTIFKSMEVQP